MFHKPQLDKKETTIDSLIGKKIHILGDVIFEGGLRLDGQITGNLKIKEQQTGTLVISEQARVVGEVHVTHLVMNGFVEGDVHVSSLLELQPQARIKGDVHYVMLEMHQGAIVEGRLIHTPSLEKPVQAHPSQNQQAAQVLSNHEQGSTNSNANSNSNTNPSYDNQNLAPVGFNLNAPNLNANLHENANHHSGIPSLFADSKGQTREEGHDNSNHSENIFSDKDAKDAAAPNPLEQLQNKISEGLSFFKSK